MDNIEKYKLPALKRENSELLEENIALRKQIQLFKENCSLRAATVFSSLLAWLDADKTSVTQTDKVVKKLEDVLNTLSSEDILLAAEISLQPPTPPATPNSTGTQSAQTSKRLSQTDPRLSSMNPPSLQEAYDTWASYRKEKKSASRKPSSESQSVQNNRFGAPSPANYKYGQTGPNSSPISQKVTSGGSMKSNGGKTRNSPFSYQVEIKRSSKPQQDTLFSEVFESDSFVESTSSESDDPAHPKEWSAHGHVWSKPTQRQVAGEGAKSSPVPPQYTEPTMPTTPENGQYIASPLPQWKEVLSPNLAQKDTLAAPPYPQYGRQSPVGQSNTQHDSIYSSSGAPGTPRPEPQQIHLQLLRSRSPSPMPSQRPSDNARSFSAAPRSQISSSPVPVQPNQQRSRAASPLPNTKNQLIHDDHNFTVSSRVPNIQDTPTLDARDNYQSYLSPPENRHSRSTSPVQFGNSQSRKSGFASPVPKKQHRTPSAEVQMIQANSLSVPHSRGGSRSTSPNKSKNSTPRSKSPAVVSGALGNNSSAREESVGYENNAQINAQKVSVDVRYTNGQRLSKGNENYSIRQEKDASFGYNHVGLPIAASTPHGTGASQKNMSKVLNEEQELGYSRDMSTTANTSYWGYHDRRTQATPEIDAILNFLNNAKPNKRLIGEVAYQLDRRILGYVFNINRDDHPYKRRFYGYTLQNIKDMIKRESLDNNTGFLDVKIQEKLNYRLNYILYSLAPMGYDLGRHAMYSAELVNRYGLLPIPSNQATADLFCLKNKNFIAEYLKEISPQKEVNDIMILFECLALLAQDEAKPLFTW